ncbi:enoyl-CoA hydratase-related protein [Hydrogenophaga sp. BPS33]|uniref:enoyl-CoA hydratase-related protein n=1 Tax=Hydrogenophaga sp. BPS33 TaxID=2651974 RepID=UPI00135CC888|nr:enoyl-CoA hydratase-related protein [Hydrogenophaga sp. BPS33]
MTNTASLAAAPEQDALPATLGTPGIRVDVDADHIALLTIDLPGQSANTMSVAFKEELRRVVERLEQHEGLRGVVITSSKKTFFAGGDLRILIAVQPSQAQSFFDGLEWFKQTLRRLERLPIPVAVAINGAALGGGWEICLCAHARFCLADDSIPLGLPEATLGLLPGAGGVNRMVRLLGLQRALPLLMDGRSFSPSKALAMGLLHGTAPDMPAVIVQARQWVRDHPRPVVPWDQPGFDIPGLRHELAAVLRSAALQVLAHDQGRYPARQAILAAAVEGACLDIDSALRVETRYLTSLATQPVAKNMIQTQFFDANDIRAGKGRPSDAPRTELHRIGLDVRTPGAVALVLAHTAKRLHTVLRAGSAAQLEACRCEIDAALRQAVAQRRMTQERADAASALVSSHIAAQGDDGMTEDLLITVADAPLRAEGARGAVVLAAHASAAEALAHGVPALRFIPDLDGGLVEVVHGPNTPMNTVALAYDYAQRIGKTPVRVRDAGEGYVARLGRAAAEEAGWLRQQGVGDALIENAALQTHLAQGPLALAARFGVVLPDAHAAVSPLPDVREIQDRVLFAIALAAARCLEDGVIASVRDANIGSILGMGFPRWTGGALQYIQQYGIARFVQRADALAGQLGDRFTPCALLRGLAERQASTIEVAV